MDAATTINAQVTIPTDLYQAIEQRAQIHGHSISTEIVDLLMLAMPEHDEELAREFAQWEAASDEDWQAMEVIIASESR